MLRDGGVAWHGMSCLLYTEARGVLLSHVSLAVKDPAGLVLSVSVSVCRRSRHCSRRGGTAHVRSPVGRAAAAGACLWAPTKGFGYIAARPHLRQPCTATATLTSALHSHGHTTSALHSLCTAQFRCDEFRCGQAYPDRLSRTGSIRSQTYGFVDSDDLPVRPAAAKAVKAEAEEDEEEEEDEEGKEAEADWEGHEADDGYRNPFNAALVPWTIVQVLVFGRRSWLYCVAVRLVSRMHCSWLFFWARASSVGARSRAKAEARIACGSLPSADRPRRPLPLK
jgi:hypothetical protein